MPTARAYESTVDAQGLPSARLSGASPSQMGAGLGAGARRAAGGQKLEGDRGERKDIRWRPPRAARDALAARHRTYVLPRHHVRPGRDPGS